jgi:hypothetical protein
MLRELVYMTLFTLNGCAVAGQRWCIYISHLANKPEQTKQQHPLQTPSKYDIAISKKGQERRSLRTPDARTRSPCVECFKSGTARQTGRTPPFHLHHFIKCYRTTVIYWELLLIPYVTLLPQFDFLSLRADRMLVANGSSDTYPPTSAISLHRACCLSNSRSYFRCYL